MTSFSSLVVETVSPVTVFSTVIPDGLVVSPFLETDWRSFTVSGIVAVHLSPVIVTSPVLALDKTVFFSSFKWTLTTLLVASNPPKVPLSVRLVEVTAVASKVGFWGVTWTSLLFADDKSYAVFPLPPTTLTTAWTFSPRVRLDV